MITWHKKLAAVLLTPTVFLASALGQDVSLQRLNGERLNLASLRGKVVVLLLTGMQDPQCRDEFRALGALSERYSTADVSVFWVSINSSKEVSDDQLQEPCGPTGAVTVLRDPGQAAFKRLSPKASQLPTIVILDKQGRVHGQPKGGFNPNSDFVNDLAAIIDTLLK